MANLQRQSLVDRKHFCLNSELEILRKTGVFPSFESSCGSVDFPRPSLLVASLPCRPIPALPAHSLCSSPQRKCQVWPLEGAGGPVRTKKSLGFPNSPTPLPLITMIGGAVPVQQNAAEVQPGKVVTLGKAAPATRQMSQFFSARGLSSSTQLLLLQRARSCVWKFSAFADTEFSTKKKKEEAAFDTHLDCSHSDHNISCWMEHTM